MIVVAALSLVLGEVVVEADPAEAAVDVDVVEGGDEVGVVETADGDIDFLEGLASEGEGGTAVGAKAAGDAGARGEEAGLILDEFEIGALDGEPSDHRGAGGPAAVDAVANGGVEGSLPVGHVADRVRRNIRL